MVIAFIAGLLLGWIYVQTDSLLLVILLHILNNIIAVISIHYFGVTNIILSEVEFIPVWQLLLALLFSGMGIYYLAQLEVADN